MTNVFQNIKIHYLLLYIYIYITYLKIYELYDFKLKEIYVNVRKFFKRKKQRNNIDLFNGKNYLINFAIIIVQKED
ncbi:hypothetical protein PFAG_04216 [Plasmodium falciparum Santa Lucia]|uniref:Uncharacterized protein n=7 Tax=Plasmodium falciparum TaxID=5833 RepID=W4J2C2_PLAFP|nr:hypothetical protein PFFVO_03824 [Plasmodium falciparum Vietnam Oak-Knoll (FVO)]ETW41388.1 hypothetical protein PFNF135_04374 [Plasmodium falciparum NF135/5.C10]ETW47898.1 hypothetical protein PFMALIP_04086 [Plasmodium falciparum MaliPS096_E11]ETW55791.1 hypothetical protein PFUGPA_02235 [Plasmodium falciparum Palo Alto/Uganda]ETW60014.1 hypothetical protein PFMC_04190 [Plasmodium falciparum CAMP/Malaysia]EUR67457.1 hypothetical protein PFBG_04137 [Plasmodium falciparum 7G8]EUT82034.1 hypo